MNEHDSENIAGLLEAMGYGCVELRDDQFGRPRFIKALI